MTKFKSLPIYWQSENGRCIIVYSQFDMGKKYKLYVKGENNYFSYNYASESLGQLIDYAKKNYYATVKEMKL